MNKKFVYRLYCEEGLGIRRRKPRRRKRVRVFEARPPTGQTNESWSMDFMTDRLLGGQLFQLLTPVDNHSRESLAIEVGQRLFWQGSAWRLVAAEATAKAGRAGCGRCVEALKSYHPMLEDQNFHVSSDRP